MLFEVLDALGDEGDEGAIGIICLLAEGEGGIVKDDGGVRIEDFAGDTEKLVDGCGIAGVGGGLGTA